MKFCTQCGDTYTDPIEFCFQDGEVLRLLPAKAVIPRPTRKREAPDPNLALIMEVAAAVHASVAAANPHLHIGGPTSR